MLDTFCLRLAGGLAAALLFLPSGGVQPRFQRIQLLIVLGLIAAAGALAWTADPGDAFWVWLGLAAAGSLVGTVTWSFEGAPGGSVAVVVAAGAALAAGIARNALPDASSWAWGIVDGATAAGLLGAATTAMLLGHWYLIAPTMSIRPLLGLLAWLFVAAGLRVLVAAAGVWSVLQVGTMYFDAPTWIWLGVRWGVGLAGPIGLGWMAWQAARIRSTQSATGILYVLVIFTFLGELTDQLLQEHRSE